MNAPARRRVVPAALASCDGLCAGLSLLFAAGPIGEHAFRVGMAVLLCARLVLARLGRLLPGLLAANRSGVAGSSTLRIVLGFGIAVMMLDLARPFGHHRLAALVAGSFAAFFGLAPYRKSVGAPNSNRSSR